MSMLVTALSLEGADGQFVPLLVPGARGVEKADGLVGMSTREKVRPKPGRHGVIITSRYRDADPITLNGWLTGPTPDATWSAYNALAQACASAVANDRMLRWSGGSVLALVETRVRLVSLTPPLEAGPNLIRYQLVLRPGDPRSYAQAETVVDGGLLSMSGGGKIYPYRYPRAYTPAGGSAASFTVAGTDSTPAVFRIYGFATSPRLKLVSTGEQLFIGGAVDAGRYLEVDVDAREVRLDTGEVRNNLFDFEQSSWFELPPGPQSVQMLATSFDASAHVQVRYRPAYA